MKAAYDCKDIEEIRHEIDRIDNTIIKEISSRAEYVRAAARFKTDSKSVKAPDRVKKMLQKRREWAEEKSLDPDVIEKLFSDLVNYFINEEMKYLK